MFRLGLDFTLHQLQMHSIEYRRQRVDERREWPCNGKQINVILLLIVRFYAQPHEPRLLEFRPKLSASLSVSLKNSVKYTKRCKAIRKQRTSSADDHTSETQTNRNVKILVLTPLLYFLGCLRASSADHGRRWWRWCAFGAQFCQIERASRHLGHQQGR